MNPERKQLELLAPAKNLEFGIAAINHGADAVYIGGPQFGARAAAGNSVADIAALTHHAHRYSARVYVALNTILRDDELEDAAKLAKQLYETGADALIVQDMGLLQLDLPPIALHASTQTDNRTPEKVRFLEQVGFSQVVLARELSLAEIRTIAEQTSATLEFFIHGALCVSYSGLCNISQAYSGRSANRGECAQHCRLPYTLIDTDGRELARDQHLLSLKDMNQSENLAALVEAGITSFKIEGRLKDLSYVKNVTAYYRQRLDHLLQEKPEFKRASAGRCTFFFEPQPEKSFNRGATDYFLNGRQMGITSFLTPKFAGTPIGKVQRKGQNYFEIDGKTRLNNGDGVSYFNAEKELTGLRINRVDANRLYPAEMPEDLAIGTALYRNLDQEFEKQLEKKSAERKIGVTLEFVETPEGFALTMTDEEGVSATAFLAQAKEPAQNPAKAEANIREQLGKLGNTLFEAQRIDLNLNAAWFIQVSVLNGTRREAAEKLEAARLANYRRTEPASRRESSAPYPEATLNYLGNVYNREARTFYEQHGVESIAPAFEVGREREPVSLMITRHCLRYSFNRCPKQVKGIRPDPMILKRGSEEFTLRFDCQRCEMHVVGRPDGGKKIR
jgi:23S rRNA 5-hydroxycytidine C2501 synthase